MSRIRQVSVAIATFSVALGIGFVMQKGDALAARFADPPAVPAPHASADLSVIAASAPPRSDRAGAATAQPARIDPSPPATGIAVREEPAAQQPTPSATVATLAEPVPPLHAAVGTEKVAAALPRPDAEAGLVLARLDAHPPAPTGPAPSLPGTDAACAPSVTAEVIPAALVILHLSAPCAPSARAIVRHEDLVFSVTTDMQGRAEVTVPALARTAIFTIHMDNAGDVKIAVPVPEIAAHDRAVLQWQGATGPEIHVREFGAAYGSAGHVWHGAPRGPDAAVNGTGGFLLQLGDGQGLNPLMAEVYTFPSSDTRLSGEVEFSIETPVTEKTCGRTLSAQTIQVSPGADAFSFDLNIAVPGCAAIGDIVILRDVILDLTVAAR